MTGRQTGRPPRLALALAVVLAAVLWLAPLLTQSRVLLNQEGWRLLLDAAGVAVATLIGVLCLIRWRLLGQASLLWLAAAALTYGLVTVGAGHVLPALMSPTTPPDVLRWLHPASRTVAIGMLIAGLAWPDVDASLRPGRVLAVAAGATAGLTLVFQLLPGLATSLAGAQDSMATEGFPIGSLIIIVTLAVTGAGFLHRAATLPRPLFAWFGVMVVALLLAEVHRVLPFTDEGMWAVGDGVLRLVGLLTGVTGVVASLASDYGAQSGRLLESVTSGLTAEARIRAEQAAAEERAHEARNALAAIEGATRTLEHYRDRLDADTRASLTEAVSAEIARLQRLVSVEAVTSTTEVFSVDRALRAVVTAARAQGADLKVDIDPDAVAVGRGPETAEVVQNLIENARRYAPDSPITLRTEEEPAGLVIRVEDRGPGVPVEERRSIFSRGYRGRTTSRAEGSGLGLYVSHQLMREQDGDLWVEPRPGGGSSFALWLPSPRNGAVEHEVDDVGEVVDRHLHPPPDVGDRAETADRRRLREVDDDVRGEVGR